MPTADLGETGGDAATGPAHAGARGTRSAPRPDDDGARLVRSTPLAPHRRTVRLVTRSQLCDTSTS
ncbi:hypothetical protein [Microbispora sp. NPDC049125]|uniref:hypothetical protein n=1 Tax=Microbispora sp. NPDC049125 TaxID=3154929 RepID=UPI0034674575